MLFYFTNVIVAVILKRCLASKDIYLDSGIRKSNEVDLKESFFASLEDYHVNATSTTEKKYSWIARVVHSRSSNQPHLCTASFVDKGIFITAARCIFSLKVKHTSVVFRAKRIFVRAFVFPTKHTSQYYDDIGFIITEPVSNVDWSAPVKLYDKKRTDKKFEWFSKMKFGADYKVIGYATSKNLVKLKAPHRQYSLSELPVVIGIDICSKISTLKHMITGFKVPCYHSCTVKEFFKLKPQCLKYHGVEGGAIYNIKDKSLFGVATWGAYYQDFNLPVGFSVVNSQNFFDDFKCAKKVRDAKSMKMYQHLCK